MSDLTSSGYYGVARPESSMGVVNLLSTTPFAKPQSVPPNTCRPSADLGATLARLSALIFGLVLTVVAGCGGPYDASVSGIATLNSTPLVSGTVKFTPEQTGPSGYGLIEPSGAYTIMIGREEGLPSGSYVVTVVANEPSIPNKNESLPPAPGKPITPIWYRDPAQSPLKYKVEPGSNEFNLELTSQPPAGWKPPGRR